MKKIYRVATIAIWDVILTSVSFVFSVLIFANGSFLEIELNQLLYIAGVCSAIKILVFNLFSLYSSLWEYASIEELIKVVGGVSVGNLLCLFYVFLIGNSYYIGVYIMVYCLDLILIGGFRFSYRVLRRLKQSKGLFNHMNGIRVLIIGTGSTASLVAREIKTHTKQYGHLMGFIDFEDSKVGQTISGVKVIGNTFDILSISKRLEISEIIVAIPTASKEETRLILEECKRSGSKVKIVPGIMEVIDGHVSMNKIRNVEIEDLLGRDPVNLNMDEAGAYITNKIVMITGGGGSIGSELCRQIARLNPKRVIILDIYENNAYDLQNELLKQYGSAFDLKVLIASVRDSRAVRRIIKSERPDVVFHAAAHKHVPLMETSPREAVKNNVLGTLNVAEAAHEFGVGSFVLISTDKAVNPTNVMGASKRLCEMVIQSMSAISQTKFVAVRFGNVLGSNGSVIPLFKKQIEEGGPITVTHKDIIRYFMTIPEASQLVIQAGAIANGGEIFILDMGDPVRIYDLAEDLIRLSGLKPHEDILIEVTGLRPGEKLYEELLMDEEGLLETKYEKIHIGEPVKIDFEILRADIKSLESVIRESEVNDDYVRERLAILVPTYLRTQGEVALDVGISE